MSVSRERKKITNKQGLSKTTIQAWASVVFSLPFLGVGIAAMLIGADVIPVELDQQDIPGTGVVLFGGILFLAGFSLFIHGLKGVVRKRRSKQLLAESPDKPWLADYDWNETGWDYSPLGKAGAVFYKAVFFGLFLLPFNYFVFMTEEMPVFIALFIGLFDLVPVGLCLYAGYLLIRYVKYGTSYIEFGDFPFFLGKRADITFFTSKDIGRIKNLDVQLRCVEEKYERHGTGSNRSSVVVCYQIYSDTSCYSQETELHPHIDKIPLSFDLPEDTTFETVLASRPPTYWELIIKAETPGVDFSSEFLIPVYRRP